MNSVSKSGNKNLFFFDKKTSIMRISTIFKVKIYAICRAGILERCNPIKITQKFLLRSDGVEKLSQ